MSALPWALAEGRGIYMVEDTGTPEPSQPGRFVKLPVSILNCRGLSAGARLLYAALAQHDGERGCFPSHALLADETGFSMRAIVTYRGELEAAGVLDHRRGGGGSANRYELHPERLDPMLAKSAKKKLAKSASKEPKLAKSAPYVGKICQSKLAKSAKELDPENQTQERDTSHPTGAARGGVSAGLQATMGRPPRPVPKPTSKAKAPPCSPEASQLLDWLYDVQQQARPEGYRRPPELKAAGDFLACHAEDVGSARAELDLQRQGRRVPLQMKWALANVLARQANGHGGHDGQPSETGRGQRAVPGETGDVAREAQERADKRAYLDRQRALARAIVPAVPISDP